MMQTFDEARMKLQQAECKVQWSRQVWAGEVGSAPTMKHNGQESGGELCEISKL